MAQDRRSSARHYQPTDRQCDVLVVRLRRLALHRGYDRTQLSSPLLRRLMPSRRPLGDPAAETADLSRRVREAALDQNAIAYLIETAEDELDLARIRLT